MAISKFNLWGRRGKLQKRDTQKKRGRERDACVSQPLKKIQGNQSSTMGTNWNGFPVTRAKCRRRSRLGKRLKATALEKRKQRTARPTATENRKTKYWEGVVVKAGKKGVRTERKVGAGGSNPRTGPQKEGSMSAHKGKNPTLDYREEKTRGGSRDNSARTVSDQSTGGGKVSGSTMKQWKINKGTDLGHENSKAPEEGKPRPRGTQGQASGGGSGENQK